MFWDELGPSIALFRFYNQNNFYALELNFVGQKQVVLVKKSEGVGKTVADTNVFF